MNSGYSHNKHECIYPHEDKDPRRKCPEVCLPSYKHYNFSRLCTIDLHSQFYTSTESISPTPWKQTQIFLDKSSSSPISHVLLGNTPSPNQHRPMNQLDSSI